MKDPLVIRINEILTEDDFRYVSRKLKQDNPNVIVLPSYCEVLHPQIIKCEDCKYYLKSNEECQLIKTRLHFYETDKRWTEDSFCSWAERKT